MEIKYTTDGKKVGVVGKLNNQETIVQEIFVANGNEIPSGENFVVRSLHDAPAVSWKVKNAEAEELACKKRVLACDELKKKIGYEHDRLESLLSSLRKYKSGEQFLKVFDGLSDFLTGQITHLVKIGYNCEIVPFLNATAGGEYNRNYMKLISLFGGSDGDLEWRINEYSDGSGSKTTFIPAKSYESAVEILSAHVNAKAAISSYDFALMAKYGVRLDAEKVQAFNDQQRGSVLQRIEKLEKDIRSAKDELLSITPIS